MLSLVCKQHNLKAITAVERREECPGIYFIMPEMLKAVIDTGGGP